MGNIITTCKFRILLLTYSPYSHNLLLFCCHPDDCREDEIIRAIKKAEVRSDIVAIVRGGGSRLEVFDSFDLANMVLDTRIPVIAAIGHDEDDTLVKQIADKAFSTPTAFGNYLREMALGIEGDRKIEEEVNNNILNQSNWGLVCGIAVTAIIFFLLFWKN